MTVLIPAPARGRGYSGHPLGPAPAKPAQLPLPWRDPPPPRPPIPREAFAPDQFAVHGHEVYVHCPGGYGNTKINNAYFERKLGVVATTRNWKTVNQLAEMSTA